MVKRVVITGIGPVTSLGIGKDDFFKNILKGETPVATIPETFNRTYSFKSQHYIPFPKYSLKEYGLSTKYNSILQNEDSLALLGTKLALEDAGFSLTKENGSFETSLPRECSVTLGIGMTSLNNAFSSHLAHLGVPHPDSNGKTGRFNRMIIPMMMSNSPAAWISILFGIEGAVHTVNASCASGTVAIGQAFRDIKEGRSRVAISGGVESLVDPDGSVMRGFDMLGTLTTSENGIPLPFSEKRDGFLFAEGGGTVLVLEELEHAQQRGADIYGEITKYAENSDAFNIVQINKSGTQIESLLTELSQGEEIEYINSHGTGTALNDDTESKIIQKLFPQNPLINSTKAILGHTIGASGAIEAAVTALAVKEGQVHGNRYGTPLDNLNLIKESRSEEINKALTVSYGFGGHNAGLCIKRFES